MRTGLMIIAAATTLGTAAIATPASAQGYYGGGYGHHEGWRGGDRYDRGRDWHRARWERERARDWRWRHHHEYDRHRYRGYYGW